MPRDLESSVVALSRVVRAARTVRLDSEYYRRRNLADEDLVVRNRDRFKLPREIGVTVDASAFYPSIEGYYDTGEMPFYRVGDVDGIVDVENATRIPHALYNELATLKRAQPGDILFTKGGAVDRTGYVTKEGAISRDLIVANTSCLARPRRVLLFVYFQTEFFRRLLVRSSSQTAQPHLTVTLVRELPWLVGSSSMADVVDSRVGHAVRLVEAGRELYREAAALLANALGLAEWKADTRMCCTARARRVMEEGRMDPKFFAPKYDSLAQHFEAHGIETRRLGDIRSYNARGLQPKYVREGEVRVVNSRHILEERIDYERLERTSGEWLEGNQRARVRRGDILTYTTGAKIGRTGHFGQGEVAVASNHVNILRLNEGCPEYVGFVMNSVVGRVQTERFLSGTAQPELYPSDIDRFVIPFVRAEVQREIRENLRNGEEAYRRGRELLRRVTGGVEVAIGSGEAEALAALDAAG